MNLVPYAKEIDAAIKQIDVAVEQLPGIVNKIRLITLAAFIVAFSLQFWTVVLLGFIFLSIMALIICVTPELAHERRVLVTPVIQYFTQYLVKITNNRPNVPSTDSKKRQD